MVYYRGTILHYKQKYLVLEYYKRTEHEIEIQAVCSLHTEFTRSLWIFQVNSYDLLRATSKVTSLLTVIGITKNHNLASGWIKLRTLFNWNVPSLFIGNIILDGPSR